MIGSHTATPKSYLRQFTSGQTPSDPKPRLWVYQRGAPPFSSMPHRVGKENGYFAVTRADGSRDESMETILSTFEGRGAELLRFVGNEAYVLSPRDKEAFTGYVALIFARAAARRALTAKILSSIRQAYQELSTDPDWLHAQVVEYERFSGVLTSPEQISTATRKVLDKLARPESAGNGFVQGLLRIAQSIFALLADKPWQIWEAPESLQFVTSDNPVITIKADTWGSFLPGWGFNTPGVITVFPVSPRCCLLIGASGRYWRRATVRDVNGVNKGLVMCMDRWAYSAVRSDDIEWLVNHTGGSVRYGENAFVPGWMNNASEDIKAKVREATRPSSGKIGPRSSRSRVLESLLKATESK